MLGGVIWKDKVGEVQVEMVQGGVDTMSGFLGKKGSLVVFDQTLTEGQS